VLSDVLLAVDEENMVVVALLDLSAAFDMVDHGILLQHLKSSHGFEGPALRMFRLYSTGRTLAVHGGYALGPIMFIYTHQI